MNKQIKKLSADRDFSWFRPKAIREDDVDQISVVGHIFSLFICGFEASNGIGLDLEESNPILIVFKLELHFFCTSIYQKLHVLVWNNSGTR